MHTDEERAEIIVGIQDLVDDGLTVEGAAVECGITSASYYAWLKKPGIKKATKAIRKSKTSAPSLPEEDEFGKALALLRENAAVYVANSAPDYLVLKLAAHQNMETL